MYKQGLFYSKKQVLHCLLLNPREGSGVQDTEVSTAVLGKVVQRRRKAYATILKGSMGLSEESVHVLNPHMITKKMNNDFQCFGNECVATTSTMILLFHHHISIVSPLLALPHFYLLLFLIFYRH